MGVILRVENLTTGGEIHVGAYENPLDSVCGFLPLHCHYLMFCVATHSLWSACLGAGLRRSFQRKRGMGRKESIERFS